MSFICSQCTCSFFNFIWIYRCNFGRCSANSSSWIIWIINKSFLFKLLVLLLRHKSTYFFRIIGNPTNTLTASLTNTSTGFFKPTRITVYHRITATVRIKGLYMAKKPPI